MGPVFHSAGAAYRRILPIPIAGVLHTQRAVTGSELRPVAVIEPLGHVVAPPRGRSHHEPTTVLLKKSRAAGDSGGDDGPRVKQYSRLVSGRMRLREFLIRPIDRHRL
jgi:hypothetical protein